MNKVFGKKGKDVISGFEGTIIGYCEYYTGCATYLLVPSINENGQMQLGEWIDTARIEILETIPKKLALNNLTNNTGGDISPTCNNNLQNK